MSNQNPSEQINKASWTIMESIKDSVQTTVSAAARNNFKIEPQELVKLLSILNASVEEGYHRSARTFSRVVEGVIHTALEEATMPTLGKKIK